MKKSIYKRWVVSADWLESIWSTALKASRTKWTTSGLRASHKGIILPTCFLSTTHKTKAKTEHGKKVKEPCVTHCLTPGSNSGLQTEWYLNYLRWESLCLSKIHSKVINSTWNSKHICSIIQSMQCFYFLCHKEKTREFYFQKDGTGICVPILLTKYN
jgi:hypothetical protein